jgi:hypothetical protein
VNGVSLVLILLSEDLLVSIVDVLGVLLEKVIHTNVEILVTLHCVCIVEDCVRELSVLNVHVLEPVSVFFSKKLVKKYFL